MYTKQQVLRKNYKIKKSLYSSIIFSLVYLFFYPGKNMSCIILYVLKLGRLIILLIISQVT